MPKEFYTERDIEDMVKRGVLSLELNDRVVLTDLAYEKAARLGMQLVRDKPENPPAAPVRPYLSQPQSQPAASFSVQNLPAVPQPAAQASLSGQPDGTDLHKRIHNAVMARLGSQIDAKLLDVIIARVLNSTGVK